MAGQPKIWFQPGVTDETDHSAATTTSGSRARRSRGDESIYQPGATAALGSYGASGGAIAATQAAETRNCMEGKGLHVWWIVANRGRLRPRPTRFIVL